MWGGGRGEGVIGRMGERDRSKKKKKNSQIFLQEVTD